jgi:putative peptide zinc metalloprotease protein
MKVHTQLRRALIVGACMTAGFAGGGSLQARAQVAATPSDAAVATSTAADPAPTTPVATPSATTAPASATATAPASGETAIQPSATAPAAATETPAPAEATPVAGTVSGDDDDAVEVDQELPGGGGTNNVRLRNRTDGRLRLKGRVQVNRIPGPGARPENTALAVGSCTGCQTLAVAFQLNLVSRTATNVSPENAAVALNNRCTGCYTRSWAMQYTVAVDDPSQPPDDVQQLARDIEAELRAIHSDQSVTLPQAVSRIKAVQARFADLGQYVQEQAEESQGESDPGAGGQ